jgi:hypothetical protein
VLCYLNGNNPVVSVPVVVVHLGREKYILLAIAPFVIMPHGTLH